VMADPQEIQQQARLLHASRQPEAVARLLELVFPKLAENIRTLVYVLLQVDRIGQLATELCQLKALYYDSYDQIIIITGPVDKPGVNLNVIEVAGDKFCHIETYDPVLPYFGFNNWGLAEFKNMDLLAFSPWTLWNEYKKLATSSAAIKTAVDYRFELPSSTEKRGRNWMQKVGMNIERPIVLLHVRDRGYRPQQSRHEYRCADISNYDLAIKFLVSKGYQVIRIGDNSNPKIKADNSWVWDLPFHPEYENFLDVYFSAICAFAILQASGPVTLPRAFSRHALIVNRVVDWEFHGPNEVLMFKHYCRIKDGVELSYREILANGLAEITTSQELADAGFFVKENSPEELMLAVEEFLGVLKGKNPLSPALQEKFLKLNKEHSRVLAEESEISDEDRGIFGLAYSTARISESILQKKPSFLA